MLERTRRSRNRGASRRRRSHSGNHSFNNAGTSLVAGAAEISRVAQHGIDHQRAAAIMSGGVLKPHFAILPQCEASRDRSLLGSKFLVDTAETAKAVISPLPWQNQLPLLSRFAPFRALELQRDLAGVGAGSDFEVVLQLSLVAVVPKVNPRIDVPYPITHAGELRDVAAPFRPSRSNSCLLPGVDWFR